MQNFVMVYGPLVNNLQSPDSCGRPVHCVGKQGTGEGVLRADLPGREPTATKARQEIGAVEATALGSRGGICLKTKNVIFLGLTLSKPNVNAHAKQNNYEMEPGENAGRFVLCS